MRANLLELHRERLRQQSPDSALKRAHCAGRAQIHRPPRGGSRLGLVNWELPGRESASSFFPAATKITTREYAINMPKIGTDKRSYLAPSGESERCGCGASAPAVFLMAIICAAGAIARFSPVMSAVKKFAADGGRRPPRLQRIPDSRGSRATAGRSFAQSGPQDSSAAKSGCGPKLSTRPLLRSSTRVSAALADRAWRRPLFRRPEHARCTRGGRSRGISIHR